MPRLREARTKGKQGSLHVPHPKGEAEIKRKGPAMEEGHEGATAAIQRFCLSDFKGGWFIGDFEPSILRTKHFEVALKRHLRGEEWPKHKQKEATEYNLVTMGLIQVGDKHYGVGDIFVVPPGLAMKPEFIDPWNEVVCIKVPSLPGDKHMVSS